MVEDALIGRTGSDSGGVTKSLFRNLIHRGVGEVGGIERLLLDH